MSQEQRKSLVLHTICCNSSLLQLQIIPPSTAESDNLDKQPIASRLGLEPDALKALLSIFCLPSQLKRLDKLITIFPRPIQLPLSMDCQEEQKGLENLPIYKCWSCFGRAVRQSEKGFWIFIRRYIFFMPPTARHICLHFSYQKHISLNTEVPFPHCLSHETALKLQSIFKQSKSIYIRNKSYILYPTKWKAWFQWALHLESEGSS